MKKTNYPEWALKHKGKGKYLKKIKGGYQLFRAHSEFNSTTKKSKLVYDEYLGKITEKDGLIPPKNKDITIEIYEYGVSNFILQLCETNLKVPQSLNYYSKIIKVNTILNIIYGEYNSYLYKNSYLKLIYANIEYKDYKKEVINEINKKTTLIKRELQRKYKFKNIRHHLNNIKLIKYKDIYSISKIDDITSSIISDYNINLDIKLLT